MRIPDYERDARSFRPKSARIDEDPPSRMVQAAATGRAEVLDRAAVLGLQRSVGNAGVGAALEDERSPVHDVIGSGGSALPSEVRGEMEARLGYDFSDVRIHSDAAAHESAKSVSAHAYTVGSNVVFQQDKYDPSSTEGKTMLAHELTHVVQQRSGPVDGSPARGGIKVSDPSDRFEREAAANAHAVMAAPLQPAAAATPGAASIQRTAAPDAEGIAQPLVQREASDEEEEEAPVQGAFVQREEEQEEEPS